MSDRATNKYANLHFLVADDQAFSRNLLRIMLRSLSVTKITFAVSGEEAALQLKRLGTQIDCVIADWNMAPTNGLQLLRIIRTGSITEVPANLPFVMLTGHSTSPVVTTALNLDVDAFVVKPSSTEKMATAIGQALGRTRVAKPPSFYERIEDVSLPDTIEGQVEDPATWAKWVKSGRPVCEQNPQTFVKRDSIALAEAPEPKSEIKQVRYRRADRIKPGYVLAEELRDADGAVLIKSGTILNEKLLNKVLQMKDEKGNFIRLLVGRLEES